MPLVPGFLHANGLEFGVLEAGPATGELVLIAHGFPDTAWSFLPVIEQLAAAGYRVVAPFMRGYLPTAMAPDGDYRLTTLARDLIALIDELGASKAVIVGHDWGAVAAYTAAALRPDRVRAVVCVAIPHLRRFLLRPTPGQLVRSRYMLRFQWPDAESMLAREDFAALKALAQAWSPDADLSTTLNPVIAGFADRPRLSAALGYYRCLPRSIFGEGWSLCTALTAVPACVIHGGRDGCVSAEMFADQAHLFAAGVHQVCFENAGHFMQVEQPVRFAETVLTYLRGLPR